MYCRISERFGWTIPEINEMDSFQMQAILEWLMENPVQIVGAVDPPKQGHRRRR
jgi:hypothetical protein